MAISDGDAFHNARWGRWSTAVNWTDVQIEDVSGDGCGDIVGRTDSGQWWVAESSGRDFVNRRAADMLAALDDRDDDTITRPMKFGVEKMR